jgi:hypothetical protein
VVTNPWNHLRGDSGNNHHLVPSPFFMERQVRLCLFYMNETINYVLPTVDIRNAKAILLKKNITIPERRRRREA